MNYFVYIKDMLGVEINAKAFQWSYGTTAPRTSRDEFLKCKFKISILVKKDKEVISKEDFDNYKGKFHFFSGELGQHRIIYDRSWIFGKRLRYKIEIDDKNVRVNVGETYFKHIKHRFMNLHSLNYLLTDIVSGIMLLNGYATLYCSAVSLEGNQGILFFSPPNVGKTVTCLKFCEKYKASFISEDIALTDGVNIWSVPWTSSYRRVNSKKGTLFEKIVNRLCQILPIEELFRGKDKKTNYEINISDRSLIKHIVLLEKEESNIIFEKTNANRKLLILNRYLLNYHKAPVISALNYFNQDFSPEDMLNSEKKIISKMLSDSEFVCVTESNVMDYADSIYKVIKNGDV